MSCNQDNAVVTSIGQEQSPLILSAAKQSREQGLSIVPCPARATIINLSGTPGVGISRHELRKLLG
jgi:hypothetical protein